MLQKASLLAVGHPTCGVSQSSKATRGPNLQMLLLAAGVLAFVSREDTAHVHRDFFTARVCPWCGSLLASGAQRLQAKQRLVAAPICLVPVCYERGACPHDSWPGRFWRCDFPSAEGRRFNQFALLSSEIFSTGQFQLLDVVESALGLHFCPMFRINRQLNWFSESSRPRLGEHVRYKTLGAARLAF